LDQLPLASLDVMTTNQDRLGATMADDSNDRIKKWKDSLFDAFAKDRVLGARHLLPILDLEPQVGAVFVDKYYGHRVLADSFMDFFAETLSTQAKFNGDNGWPQDRPHYVTCLMNLTMFRSLRSAEILSLNGYPLQGYIIQRSLKDQALILCGAANNLATFGEIFGWDGIEGEKWTDDQQSKIVKNRMKIEDKLSRKILGEKAGFSAEVTSQLETWSRLFNTEAHRGLFSLFRASHALIVGQQSVAIGPMNDQLSESMYMNRCAEICWMILRLLPFVRRAETPEDGDWDKRWVLLDDSFKIMVDGLGGLGKKIAPAIVELMNAKFAFTPATYYFEPTKAAPA
jgi:hypothetical protein